MSDSPRESVQSWDETMSAGERVRAVAKTLREPQSTNWIGEQAETSWSTTNKELQEMVEQGNLQQIETCGSTLYHPDHTQMLFDEIRTLIAENSREQLRDELAPIASEIEDWKETYDVETWQELEQMLEGRDLSSTEISERRDVLDFWQENEEDRKLLKHALELYSDLS